MSLNTKVDVPCSTVGGIPNANNKTDELLKISTLATKTNRTNTGQATYTSATSGIIYRTADYPNVVTIYNKGETGIYNLLIRLYGGNNGFIITPSDYNNIESELSDTYDEISYKINGISDTINAYPNTVSNQISALRETQNQNNQTLAQLIPFMDKDILILKATPSTNASGPGAITSARFSWGDKYPTHYTKDAKLLSFRFYMSDGYLSRYGDDGIMFAPPFRKDNISWEYIWKVGLYRPKIEISNQSKTYIDVTFQTMQSGSLENQIIDIWTDTFNFIGDVYMVLQFDK